MSDKFNPAPPDKHADKTPSTGDRAKKARTNLEEGLRDSFPASDPPSGTQPKKPQSDAPS